MCWVLVVLDDSSVFFGMVENRANNIAIDEICLLVWHGFPASTTIVRIAHLPRGVNGRGTVGYIYSLNIQCEFAS